MSARILARFAYNDFEYHDEFDGEFLLGRQRSPEEPCFQKLRDSTGWRMAVATLQDRGVSRRHALVEPLSGNRVKITNVSDANVIYVAEMPPKQMVPLGIEVRELPVAFTLGEILIKLSAAAPESHGAEVAYQSLPYATLGPKSAARMHSDSLAKPPQPSSATESDVKTLLRWLPALTHLLQSAATTDEFFQQAVSLLLEFVTLDWATVVLYDKGKFGYSWKIVAEKRSLSSAGGTNEKMPSRTLLVRLLEEKRTIRYVPTSTVVSVESLTGVDSVVAAPILNESEEVIGALYGERRILPGIATRQAISELEAQLVDTLASGVAVGLERQRQSKAAWEAQIRFEQFFTPQLAAELRTDPGLLKGREADVTLLFCDIRGFSRISHQLGPAQTVDWVVDVMRELSECVLAHQGVLIDYIGDEIMAMWGAPAQEAKHAALACEAALDMLERLPEMSARWKPILGSDFSYGIGLNSGSAYVGNTGTVWKLKYGPLGPEVNLASRVQGATKYLKVDLLVTAATKKMLPPDVITRKVCSVRVINIPEPVELYEVQRNVTNEWRDLTRSYEEALNLFERQQFHRAVKILGAILNDYPHDGPSIVLLSRASKELVEPSPYFDPAWELPGK
ncbi:MAG: adenylate/guanylate cyclase domain-containing protein [Planctomycetota bacterium]